MIQFDIDSADVRKADRWLAAMTGQLPFVTSMALTNTVKSIHANLKQQLPSRVHQPTSWTTRGLIMKFARKDNLTAAVGFNYGDGFTEDLGFKPKRGGVPSGRYMQTLALGGRRGPKGTELALRRAGIIRSDQFIRPTGLGMGRMNAAGNVTGGRYVQLLSALRANRDIGVTSNAPAGAGSPKVFIHPRYSAIMERTGSKPKGRTGKGSGRPGRPQTVGYRRGIRPAFTIIRPPQYRPQFPVQKIAREQFAKEYAGNFRAALERALASRR